MKEATKRSIVRWIHIIVAIPIYGYLYSPFEKLPQYAPLARFVFFPLMVLTGLWAAFALATWPRLAESLGAGRGMERETVLGSHL